MRHKEITEALAGAMKQEGYKLDGCDRLIIRKTVGTALTAQRRREDWKRSYGHTFNWRKPSSPRFR